MFFIMFFLLNLILHPFCFHLVHQGIFDVRKSNAANIVPNKVILEETERNESEETQLNTIKSGLSSDNHNRNTEGEIKPVEPKSFCTE